MSYLNSPYSNGSEFPIPFHLSFKSLTSKFYPIIRRIVVEYNVSLMWINEHKNLWYNNKDLI